MGSDHILIYVDECGPVPGRKETAQVRHGTNEDAMSMLDGVHMGFLIDAVLSASFGLLQAVVQ